MPIRAGAHYFDRHRCCSWNQLLEIHSMFSEIVSLKVLPLMRMSRTQNAVAHLTALSKLLSSNPDRVNLVKYLLEHKYYPLLRSAVLGIVRNSTLLCVQFD